MFKCICDGVVVLSLIGAIKGSRVTNWRNSLRLLCTGNNYSLIRMGKRENDNWRSFNFVKMVIFDS